MKKKKLIKWGVLGYGNAAQQFLDHFENNNISKIHAIASISKKQLRSKDNKKSIILYDSYLNLVKDKEIDIIYISLPNNLHNYWTLMSISNNKNILIEKPAMISTKNIKYIFKLANKKKKFIFESIYFRSHPNIEKLIKLLKNFNIKKISSIHASFGNDALGGKKFFGIRLKQPKRSNRLFNPNMYGGSIWDTGCYPITFANIFTNLFFNKLLKKKDIIHTKKKIGSTNVDMSSEVVFKLKNSKVFLKTSIEENLDNKIQIYFANGLLKIDNLLNIGKKINVKVLRNNMKEKIYIIKSKESIFKNFIKKINLTLIKNKNQFYFPSITNKETIDNINILEQWRNVNE